jgi:hypothetical protein
VITDILALGGPSALIVLMLALQWRRRRREKRAAADFYKGMAQAAAQGGIQGGRLRVRYDAAYLAWLETAPLAGPGSEPRGGSPLTPGEQA